MWFLSAFMLKFYASYDNLHHSRNIVLYGAQSASWKNLQHTTSSWRGITGISRLFGRTEGEGQAAPWCVGSFFFPEKKLFDSAWWKIWTAIHGHNLMKQHFGEAVVQMDEHISMTWDTICKIFSMDQTACLRNRKKRYLWNLSINSYQVIGRLGRFCLKLHQRADHEQNQRPQILGWCFEFL